MFHELKSAKTTVNILATAISKLEYNQNRESPAIDLSGKQRSKNVLLCMHKCLVTVYLSHVSIKPIFLCKKYLIQL